MNLPTKSQAPQSLLPEIDLQRPAETLRWPEWLTMRVASASGWGEGILIDGKRVPTIPTSMTLSGPMRSAIEARIKTISEIGTPGPAMEAIEALGKMIVFYASGRMSEDSATVKAEVYHGALADLPAWAIREAINRWFRGATGDAAEAFSFAPSPGRLRQITEFVLNVAKGQVHPLQRLLDAVPYDGLNENQRAAAQEKFADLLTGVTIGKVQGERDPTDRAEDQRKRHEILEKDRAERAARRAKEGATA